MLSLIHIYHAMKQKLENVLSKYSDELMDIYFCTDSKIQELSDKEKYLLQAAVDAVSYTHLDVYKRQESRGFAGDLSGRGRDCDSAL